MSSRSEVPAPPLPFGSARPRRGRSNVYSRSLALVLSVLFFVLALFVVMTAVETRWVTADAVTSVRQSELYQQARTGVAAEESLERKYQLEPGPEIAARHTQAGQVAVLALMQAGTHASAAEKQSLSVLLTLHALYVQTTHQALFPAVDAHDEARTLDIDHRLTEPVFARLDRLITSAARTRQADAAAHMDRLVSLQDRLVVITPMIFMLGLTALLLILRRFRRIQVGIDHDHHETLERLSLEAATDTLTALGNHRAFQEALNEAVRLPEGGQPGFSLARLDLDEFKVINDRFGHLHGDQVLAKFARQLQASFPAASYRVGGDEFAVLLPVALPQAMAQMKDFCARVGLRSEHSVSAGVAEFGPEAPNADDLEQQADQALYEAKRRGRNRVLGFSEMADRAVLLPHQQVELFRRLLADRTMDVAFQPIWCLGDARPVAYEALARPPVIQGIQGPQELFDMAARLNRAADLDELCWTTALARAHSLPAGTSLFINLSPRTLDQDAPLAPRLLSAVAGAGLRPEQIVIEVTERSVAHLDAVIEQVRLLRLSGFGVALDDVGAGNAGLEMLRQVRVDHVKIDRSIVSAAPTDLTANAVLAAIMAYAAATRVNVIVEGIETRAMLDHARAMGAQSAQGYLLGRPLPECRAAVPEVLAQQAAALTGA